MYQQVLQPNDVYPSLAALLTKDPELSVLAAIVQAVSNQSSCWDGPAGLRELDCCMCSPAANGTLYGTYSYLGEGMACARGGVYNETSGHGLFVQPYLDPVDMDQQGLYGNCSANGTYTCYENDSYGNYVPCPCPDPTFSGAARVAADAAVTVAATPKNKANCKSPGTCGWENLQGTFSLPTNKVRASCDNTALHIAFLPESATAARTRHQLRSHELFGTSKPTTCDSQSCEQTSYHVHCLMHKGILNRVA